MNHQVSTEKVTHVVVAVKIVQTFSTLGKLLRL